MGIHGSLSDILFRSLPTFKLTDESEGRILSALDQFNRSLPLDEIPADNHFSKQQGFNVCVFTLIIVNTLMLGIEIDNGVGDSINERLGFFLFDLFFFIGFLCELLARVHCDGWSYFVEVLNLFDFSIICVTAAELAVAATGQASGVLKMASAVRVVRLLRVVEKLKNWSVFRRLWALISGFIDVLKLQVYVVAVLLLVAYVGAVVMTDVIQQADGVREFWLLAPNYFGNVFVSMFTILQFGTFDSWCTDIMRPMMQISTVSVVIMFFLLVVIAFGVTNVMLAVMIEASLSRLQDSVETSENMMKKIDNMLLSKLAKEMKQYERQEYGFVTRKDFFLMLTDRMIMYKIRLLGIKIDEAIELFDIIHCDGSGKIKTVEFVLGLSKVKETASGLDLIQLIYFCQRQCSIAESALNRLRTLNEQADTIVGRLNGVGRQMSGEIVTRKDHRLRTEDMWATTSKRCAILRKLDDDDKSWYPTIL